MKSKNHRSTSDQGVEDCCPTCGVECNTELEIDEQGRCNSCREVKVSKREIFSEKVLELKLKKNVKVLGGKAIKFASKYETGYPDRLVLMPYSRADWVELKSTKGRLSERQKLVRKELNLVGHPVYVIDDDVKLNVYVAMIAERKRMDEIAFQTSKG